MDLLPISHLFSYYSKLNFETAAHDMLDGVIKSKIWLLRKLVLSILRIVLSECQNYAGIKIAIEK